MLVLLVIMVGNIETMSMRCSDLNTSWRLKMGVLFFASLFLYSCTVYHIGAIQPKGIYHRIKSGDTLWSIARAYRINVQDLAEVNNITDPNLINVDSVIFVPDVNYIVEDVMTSVDTVGADKDPAQRDNGDSPVIPPKKEPRVEKASPKLETPSVRDSPKDQQKFSVKTEAQKDHTVSPLISTKKEPRVEKTSPKPETPSVKDSPKAQQKLSVKTAASGREGDVSTLAKSESQNAAGITDRKEIPEGDGKTSTRQDIQYKDSNGNSDIIKFDRGRFIWPVKGKVRSKFGIQPNGMYSNGIRISAKEGIQIGRAHV